jgi:alpha-galactosidase
MEVTAKWGDLGIDGPQMVRDLWREKDQGIFDQQFTILVPRHGVALLRLKKQ